MNQITLPLPDGEMMLHPTLSLVAAMEQEASLMKTAERLLARELKLSEMLPLLRACYRAAGCGMDNTARGMDNAARGMDDTALDAFLLEHAPGLLLAEILVAILSPLSALGAVPPGEQETARAKPTCGF